MATNLGLVCLSDSQGRGKAVPTGPSSGRDGGPGRGSPTAGQQGENNNGEFQGSGETPEMPRGTSMGAGGSAEMGFLDRQA